MEQYYNAGYYLIKKHPINFGDDEEKNVSTCSGFINTSAYDLWALSWTNPQLDKDKKLELGLNDQTIKQMQEWADKRHKLD